MGSNGSVSGGQEVFALVAYIPQPLSSFLDELRLELVPGCKPHAHVSVLPPRPLSLSPEEVLQHARNLAGDFAPLDIEACSVELFSTTEVIYISIGAGREELRAMHRAFNSGGLAFKEPFTYHPHVTLAQELPSDQVVGLHEIARRRWAEYRGPRTFRAGNLTFVRNNGNAWIDIAELTLGAVPSLT